MTDVVRLKEVIEKSGLKKVFIADKLGITYQGYLKKENGKTEFKAKEVSVMQTLLGLSTKEVKEIFLS